MKRHLQCGEQRVSGSNIYSIYSSTTKYHSSTTKLLRTTKKYSSTTLYYKVLLQYYSVLLQSYSVLLRTTKYYSVLQSTSPVLFRTILYYKVLQNTFPQYYSVLGSATKYYSVLKSPRWNAIDIARSNRCHPPASPNTAPATKSHCHHWSLSHMKRQMAYCHCTPFCHCTPPTRLMKSFTLWRSERVKRRFSERANSRRSERCTSLCTVCRYGTARHGCMYVGCNLQQTLDKTNLQAACKAGKTLPNATGPGASGDQSAGLVPSDQLPEIRFSAILRPQVERF